MSEFDYKQRPTTDAYREGIERIFGSYCGRCLKNPCECAKTVTKEIKAWKRMNSESDAIKSLETTEQKQP